jgi:colanic acid/amylovoran biosynthesis glycosyltransferase
MRVAMIVNSFPSISEKYLLDTVAKLMENNMEIDVFAAVRSRDTIVHDVFDRYNLAARTIQMGIPSSLLRRILSFPLLFMRNLARHPIKTLRAFRIERYQRESLNLKTLYFLEAFAGRHYDAIHCQFGQNGLIGAYLKDCGFCERLIVTFHGSDITVFPRKTHRKVYEYMFSRVDAVTAGTSFTRRLILAHGCPRKTLHVIPAGIMSERFPSPKDSARLPFLMLSVGRLEEVKGIEYAVEAFSLIAEEFPEAMYLIVGEGSRRKAIAGQIRSLGLEDRVLLLGAKRDVEVMEYYARASLLVMPSVRASNGSEEGQGLVIQEAQISGLPVIATMTGGIVDGLKHGETGYLVPERDADAIAERIRELWGDRRLMSAMSSRAMAFVRSRYDMNALVNTVIKLYGSGA